MSTTTETQQEWEARIREVPDFALFSTLVTDPSPLHLALQSAALESAPEELKAKRRIVWAVLEAVKRLDGEHRAIDFLVGSPDYDEIAGAHYNVKGVVASRRAVVLGRGGEAFLIVNEGDGTKVPVVFPASAVENMEPVR